jgi:hypothetical protein
MSLVGDDGSKGRTVFSGPNACETVLDHPWQACYDARLMSKMIRFFSFYFYFGNTAQPPMAEEVRSL